MFKDIVDLICHHLSIKDQKSLILTSRAFYGFWHDNDSLWRENLKRDFGIYNIEHITIHNSQQVYIRLQLCKHKLCLDHRLYFKRLKFSILDSGIDFPPLYSE